MCGNAEYDDLNIRSTSGTSPDPHVVRELSHLHENFVIVLADKAPDIFTFVWKKYCEYVKWIILPGTLNTIWHIFLHQKCWETVNCFLFSLEYRQIMTSSIYMTFYLISRMQKLLINTDSFADSSKCSTKPLSILLTQQKVQSTVTARKTCVKRTL